jgi:hypothetical protein
MTMPDERKIAGWTLCVPLSDREGCEKLAGLIIERIADLAMYVRPRYAGGDELGPPQEIRNKDDATA